MQGLRIDGGVVDDGHGDERRRAHGLDSVDHLGVGGDREHGVVDGAELAHGARQHAPELGAVRPEEPDHVHLREHPVPRRELDELHRHHVVRRALERHQRAVHPLAERLHAVQHAGARVERPEGEALKGVADDGGHRDGHPAGEVDGLLSVGLGLVAGLGDVGEDVEHVHHADVVLADGAGGRVGLEDHGPAGADPVARRRRHGDRGDARREERVRRVRQRRGVGDLHQPALGARQVHHLALPEHAAEPRAGLLVALVAAAVVDDDDVVVFHAVQRLLLPLLVGGCSQLRHCWSLSLAAPVEISEPGSSGRDWSSHSQF